MNIYLYLRRFENKCHHLTVGRQPSIWNPFRTLTFNKQILFETTHYRKLSKETPGGKAPTDRQLIVDSKRLISITHYGQFGYLFQIAVKC